MRLSRLSTLAFSVPLDPPPGAERHPLGTPFLSYCLVRAESDDGSVGWGEISDGWGCEYPGVAAALVEEALSRFVLGEDPRTTPQLIERIWAWMRRRQGTTWLVSQAVSGVEVALWDLVAKSRGVPLSQVIGPPLHRSIPVYASGHFLGQAEAELHADFFAPALERGVGQVKVRIGTDWRADLERLAELRGLLPDDVEIGIDGNEAFSVKTAAAIARRLGDLDVSFFEEPCTRSDREGLRWLVGASPVPIAYGEHVHTLAGFRELEEGRLADIWQPDVTVCGGFLEGRAVAAVAAAGGRPISPHSATSPLGVAANLHLASLAPTLSRLEYSLGSMGRLAPFFSGGDRVAPEALEEGGLPLPEGPGLGVEPDEEALLESFPFQPPEPIRSRPPLYLGTL